MKKYWTFKVQTFWVPSKIYSRRRYSVSRLTRQNFLHSYKFCHLWLLFVQRVYQKIFLLWIYYEKCAFENVFLGKLTKKCLKRSALCFFLSSSFYVLSVIAKLNRRNRKKHFHYHHQLHHGILPSIHARGVRVILNRHVTPFMIKFEINHAMWVQVRYTFCEITLLTTYACSPLFKSPTTISTTSFIINSILAVSKLEVGVRH